MLEQLENLSLARELITILIAMIPIGELRAAIPVAITVFDFPWWKAFYLSVIGNMIPIPFLLLFFNAVAKIMQKTSIGAALVSWALGKTSRQTGAMKKYKFFGLAVFVAIPLPITGAWTGAIGAYLLGLKFWPSLLSIGLGVLGAGIIVTILTMLGWVGAGIALGVLITLAVVGALKK